MNLLSRSEFQLRMGLTLYKSEYELRVPKGELLLLPFGPLPLDANTDAVAKTVGKAVPGGNTAMASLVEGHIRAEPPQALMQQLPVAGKQVNLGAKKSVNVYELAVTFPNQVATGVLILPEEVAFNDAFPIQRQP